MEKHYDLAVLGGGPGGYVAAIRAAQLGFKTVLIDKGNLGGVCLNWGCIPTKALLKSAEVYDLIKNHSAEYGINTGDTRIDFAKIIKRSRDVSEKITKNIELLVKKNNVDRMRGNGTFIDKNTISVTGTDNIEINRITAQNIIIAAGARPRILPNIPVDFKNIITSSEAMTLEELPESMIIIGAGAIGVEFAYFYSVLGTKVTIIEMLDSLLPIEDHEVSAALERSFKKRGIAVYTKTRVENASPAENGKVTVSIEKDGKQSLLMADKVLSAVGVAGNIEGYGLENTGVETYKGYINVNKTDYSTNVDGIYAVGDIIGAPWLAHVASAEAIRCVEGLKGIAHSDVDYSSVPGCTYCQPQIASVGLTEKEAKELGRPFKIGKFPFMASGKAFAIGERDGFVKLIFDEEYGELIGAHIIGPEATELIAELTLGKTLEATAETFIKTIHAHPTLSESIMEAAAQAYGESIHI